MIDLSTDPSLPPTGLVPRTRPRRAVTFIELLIALSITAVTCGVVATLISATSVGTNSQNDGRRGLVKMQALKAALDDEFVNARAILATGTNYIVYWAGDLPGSSTVTNNAVNLSELRMLEVDASGNLNLYMLNATGAYTDSGCAASTAWYSTCTALKSTGNYPGVTIASGISSMSATLDNATPTSAKLINIRVDFNDGLVARQLVCGVALANPLSPY